MAGSSPAMTQSFGLAPHATDCLLIVLRTKYPPISPEHPRRNPMGIHITFKRPDGKDANGYLANAARGNAPGVVVIQEWWGLSEQIKGLCDRFALAGFAALGPDLYNGKGVPHRTTTAHA